MNVRSGRWNSTLLTYSRNGMFRGHRVGNANTRAADALAQAAPLVAAYERQRLTPRSQEPEMPSRVFLHGDQFEVNVAFTNAEAESQDALMVPVALGTSSALFYFFDRANAEVLVKVLDGCSVNGHWWVFVAAATSQPVKVTVYDWTRDPWSEWWEKNVTWGLADVEAFECPRGNS